MATPAKKQLVMFERIDIGKEALFPVAIAPHTVVRVNSDSPWRLTSNPDSPGSVPFPGCRIDLRGNESVWVKGTTAEVMAKINGEGPS